MLFCKPKPKQTAMDIKRLFDFVQYENETYPREDALVTKMNGNWVKTSSKEFFEKANQFSRGLIKLGVQPNDKIALISHNNQTKWNISDIGILQVGAQDVPVYPTISEDDYEYIFNHAEVKYIIVSNEEILEKVNHIKKNIPTLKDVFTFESIEGERAWQEILDLGADDSLQAELDKRKAEVKEDDLATIIYTSGTTGRPKGVMLSHKNIVSTVISSSKRVPKLPDNARLLSFLPACHIFERMIQYLYYYRGFGIYFAESIDKIGDNIREVKPHMFTAVPRLIEKVYDKIVAKGQELTGIKKALFFWAVKVGEEFDFKKEHKFPYSLKLKLARKLIFSKWREALGGELMYIVSGSAALQPRLQRVFNAATLFVLEGYGLTETSGVVSVNSPNDFWKIGTVGRPIDIVEVKIADDGEILAKGPNMLMGYYKDPEKTAEVFTGEYFHTGDIGELDADGVLRITDRKKEMFKTSGGKYVAPQLIENTMKQSPFIEQIMVVGEGQKLVAALIQPAFPFIKEWARRHHIDVGETYEEIANNPKVKERVMEEVEKYNQGFGKWEKIKIIELTPDEWSIEAGHLTPTMKLKRRVVKDIYKDLYNRIYSNL